MESVLLDAAGHRRSPATMPGYHRGRAPRNKGLRYPADPPAIEEIVAVMRTAGDGPDGARLRALLVILWRAGLRISEALDLAESDLDRSRGAVLVRRGKGGSAPRGRNGSLGLGSTAALAGDPRESSRRGLALCHPRSNSRTALEPSAARKQLRRTAALAGVRRRFAPHQLRHAHAVEMAPRGRPLGRHPASARAREPRYQLDLPARNRQLGDHRHRSFPACPGDLSHGWSHPQIDTRRAAGSVH
jgi:integrase